MKISRRDLLKASLATTAAVSTGLSTVRAALAAKGTINFADVGVSERLVGLAERQGELIAAVFERALGDPTWGLTDEQRASGREVLARQLRLEAGSG